MPETGNIGNWAWIEGGVAAPRGFYAAGVQAGLKYRNKYDVAVLLSEVPAEAAGVFTRSVVKAHPVLLSKERVQNGKAQAIVINSGYANACVGEAGDKAAGAMTAKTAECLGIAAEDVLVASTGVIGVEMPLPAVLGGIEAAAAEAAEMRKLAQGQVHPNGSENAEQEIFERAHHAALAIMTTDTAVKEYACALTCAGGVVRVGAMAKGSGMIHPNMGTMLGFMTTDAKVPAAKLQALLQEAVDESFNMVTVDGDTSTNDCVFLLANGESGIEPTGADWDNFRDMVQALAVKLAQAIARDGEGASKFLEVKVSGAKSKEDARRLAKSICASSLVKTAVFGEDPNWGRILAAMGYSGADFNPAEADIYLGPVQVAQGGRGVDFPYEQAKEILAQKDIVIEARLKAGSAEATAWGCDLTYEYVKINGSYTT